MCITLPENKIICLTGSHKAPDNIKFAMTRRETQENFKLSPADIL